MDTKSKSIDSPRARHAVLAAFCFALAITLTFGTLCAAGISALLIDDNGLWQDFDAALPKTDVWKSTVFTEQLAEYVEELYKYVSGDDDDSDKLELLEYDINSGNVIVNAVNSADGAAYPLNGSSDAIHNVGIALDNGIFYFVDYETRTPLNGPDAKNVGTKLQRSVCNTGYTDIFTNDDVSVTILVSDYINSARNGMLGYKAHLLRMLNLAFFIITVLSLLTVVMWITVGYLRPSLSRSNKNTAALLGHVWIEAKLLVYILLAVVALPVYYNGKYAYAVYTAIEFYICFWILYLLAIDIFYSRGRCFVNCIAMSLVRLYRKTARAVRLSLGRMKFTKAVMRYVWGYIILSFITVFFFALFMAVAASSGGDGVLAFLILLSFAAEIFFTVNFIKRVSGALIDFEFIADRITALRSGSVSLDPLAVSDESPLASTAADLNALDEGIKTSVAERVRSEHTKVELITNVSHDIKTPITSLVSYTELLSQVEGLPAEAVDYINVLRDKLRRLTTMIADLFDLSKATSAELKIEPAKLDFATLLRQVTAELDDRIEASNLKFIYNLPPSDTAVYVYADGDKLRRVLENLFVNALKYALGGTRVFVGLTTVGNDVKFTITNVSADEINYTAEEIMARFSRGDKSRSSEGSGLGLAIARSFTELCGGRFWLELDGDMFRANVALPKLQD